MTGRSAWRRVVRALDAWDAEVFRRTAARRSPALDVVLPALTLAAGRSLLWAAIGAGMMATGRRRAHRAARRGLASVAVTSALTNGVGRRVLARRAGEAAEPVVEGTEGRARALLRRLPLQARRLRRRVRRGSGLGGARAGAPAGRARRDAALRARLQPGGGLTWWTK